MAKGTPAKTERNRQLIELKKTMTFKELSIKFKISIARAKQIYYRGIKS
jgi:hypothetical protein